MKARFHPSPLSLHALGAGILALILSSCQTPGGGVALSGETETPGHNLPKHEYPFDENGNYREEWVRASRAVASPSRGSNSSSSSSSSSSSRRQNYHTVASGDTLWGISRRYRVSVSALKQENGLDSDVIRKGEVLRIP